MAPFHQMVFLSLASPPAVRNPDPPFQQFQNYRNWRLPCTYKFIQIQKTLASGTVATKLCVEVEKISLFAPNEKNGGKPVTVILTNSTDQQQQKSQLFYFFFACIS
jgi:hypothetical protein